MTTALLTKIKYLQHFPLHLRTDANKFYAKIPLYFERGNFIVKTAENSSELQDLIELRTEVFHREFQKKLFYLGTDCEALDMLADHLIVIDKTKNKVVGSYRLICSSYSESFYSEEEFHIQSLLEEIGIKLELSRACVHKNYRTGTAIHLLWRGLIKYMLLCKADFLFGCASVKTTCPRATTDIQNQIENRNLVLDMPILPTTKYKMSIAAVSSKENVEIPPLLESYLKAGAQVAIEPAYDRAFGCIDFFTVLKVKNLNAAHQRRYQAADNA